MAIPPQLRYWLIRLKALNRPVLWCSGLAVVLLAVVISEYRNHPEWLGRFEVEGDGPSQAASGSTLSPDEQASVADIDNLSALYSDLGINPLLPEAAPVPQPAAEPSQNLLSILQSATPAANSEATPEAADSPFSSYLEQYRFPGSSASTSTAARTPGSLGSSTLLSTALPTGPVGAEASAPSSLGSPLQRAIQQLSEQQLSSSPANNLPSSSLPGQGSAPVLIRGSDSGSEALVPGISPATLPGSNQTFLRTTPQMSPAPGTTGYVPPATLVLPGSPYGAAAVPQAVPVTPNFSPTSSGQPLDNGFATPATGGTVLPPATGSTYSTPEAVVSPAPFSAPRPPGAYTGNGYIYTFSDPNGPVR